MTKTNLLNKGVEVLGFFYHEDETDLNGVTLFVAIDSGLRDNKIEFYSPIGQHSEGNREYLEECKKVDKSTYKRFTEGIYTPSEYLDNANIVGRPEHYAINILRKYDSMEDLCEGLDSCYDLLDCGVIDDEVEQDVYKALADMTALNLWALYRFANRDDQNYDYTFQLFISAFKEGKTI